MLIDAEFGSTAGGLILASYPLAHYPSPDLAISAVFTDAVFACPAFGADVDLAKAVPLFAYEFADENAPEPFLPPVSFPYAAAHASELQFIWKSFLKPSPQLTPQEHELGEQMVSYWTQFAKWRQPSAIGSPLWFPFFGPAADIQTLVPPLPRAGFGFAIDHKCALWAALAQSAASMSSARQASHVLRGRL